MRLLGRLRSLKARLFLLGFVALIAWQVTALSQKSPARSGRKLLIAHRGASAYAPEHTLEAYRLAITQGADFVEQDLQVTKDKVLVCLHDLSLERTTDVRQVFPNRFREERQDGVVVRRWYVSDFTLAEIKQLDAGSWFDPKFKGARVPTFQEAIDAVRGKAGLYPETKAPEVYDGRGFSMEKLLVEVLRQNKLDQPGADPKTPIIIQSFSASSLRRIVFDLKIKLPLVLLIDLQGAKDWASLDKLKRAHEFAIGVGPAKAVIEAYPEFVSWAHSVGLSVTPYTFRSKDTGKFASVKEEMRHFIYKLKVDAVFTDNPDQFPRER
ncbi:MAG: glycerophosphodiester phosphodiesterase family protein [Pyrinomonadaceae bacterium]